MAGGLCAWRTVFRLLHRKEYDIIKRKTEDYIVVKFGWNVEKDKNMKRLKYMVLCIALLLLSGCGNEAENPINAVYASVEVMAYETALDQIAEIEVNRNNRQEIARLTGICQMGMGDYKAAADALEEALSYNDGFVKEVDYDINQYLAVAYYNLGQYEDAEHVYSAMAALKPKDAQVHFSYGVTLLALDKYELSKEAFDTAVALEPTNYDRIIDIYKAFYKYGYGSLGMEYVQSAMSDQAAMTDYDKGRMFYHVGKYNEAITALERVDKKKNTDVSLYLGMSYEAMGDYNYAASVYNGGIANSTNPALYNQLGLCQMKRGAYEEALNAFQEGLKCEDTSLHQSLRYNEAIAYEYLADFDTAKKLMAAYLKDYPNDETAKREYEFLKTR